MTKRKRCINLDWLEVHALEPPNEPHNADYFRKVGLDVRERDYGTRVYKDMFTVITPDGHDFVEVRRNPYSQGYLGIHAAEECHLRLVNAACYLDNAAAMLRSFMLTYNYLFQRIVRADICLDFERFDYGDEPAKFLRRYLQQKYVKINQCNIDMHGTDRWEGMEMNSVSWGSYTSDIGTKFYNKTLELYDRASGTYGKPYIRYAWLQCGLVDDFHSVTKRKPDGTVYTPQIWRVEFSIRSSVKKWFAIELNGKRKDYQSIRNTLDMYDTRSKLITLFASLANHYFHFKYVEYIEPRHQAVTGYALDAVKPDLTHKLNPGDDRKLQRKDRCRDKVLFDFKDQQLTYKVGREVTKLLADSKKSINPLDSLLRKLRDYKATHFEKDIHEAANVLIRAIEGEYLRSDMQNPWSHAELLALQQALRIHDKNPDTDIIVLMKEIKEYLRINDKTAIF